MRIRSTALAAPLLPLAGLVLALGGCGDDGGGGDAGEPIVGAEAPVGTDVTDITDLTDLTDPTGAGAAPPAPGAAVVDPPTTVQVPEPPRPVTIEIEDGPDAGTYEGRVAGCVDFGDRLDVVSAQDPGDVVDLFLTIEGRGDPGAPVTSAGGFTVNGSPYSFRTLTDQIADDDQIEEDGAFPAATFRIVTRSGSGIDLTIVLDCR